ncbi:MAG: mechanosensitive ion channel [Anaerolineaceae bacterium]|nr:mechanosensitive ion channel [Anaerolineaceae bacterium]
MEFFETFFLGMTISDWGIFILTAAGVFLLLKIIVKIVQNRLKVISERTKIDFDNFILTLIKKFNPLFFISVALWLTIFFFEPVDKVKDLIKVLMSLVFYLQIGIWIAVVIEYFLMKMLNNEERTTRDATVKLMAKIFSWAAWVILAVMAFDTLPGVEADTLITTIGVSGIAVAFALQTILSDVASAITIAFDQPFVEGDGIVVDGMGGTVEKIGLKSTRLRSWDGQEIIVSNSDLLNSRINNYQNMERRRVILNFSVVYQTSAEKLKKIPSLVEEIVISTENATYVRTHFTALSDSSLDFETMYWVDSTDYAVFMDAKHTINMALIAVFEVESIDFAYPTQTVYLEK